MGVQVTSQPENTKSVRRLRPQYGGAPVRHTFSKSLWRAPQALGRAMGHPLTDGSSSSCRSFAPAAFSLSTMGWNVSVCARLAAMV
jgi:hypothetical protein